MMMKRNNTQPLISVIIPVWNASPYLRRCLDSVCGQTLKDIEIICVNDASTDNSLEILSEYAAKDSRMRVVSLEKNSGESIARNTALAMVRGEYLGSVDNDDAIDPAFCEKLYAKAKETGADIVKGNYLEIDYNGLTREKNINSDVRKDKICFSYQWWTAIYKTSLIVDYNINFPPGLVLGGDVVFLTKAVIHAKSVEILDNTFYLYYRRRDSGYSEIFTIEKLISIFSACDLAIDYINVVFKSYINEIQYDILFYKWFGRYIDSILHPVDWENAEESSKRICLLLAMHLYRKCIRHEFLNVKLENDHPGWYKYFLSANIDGLSHYFMKNNTFKKVRIADLRTRMISPNNDVFDEKTGGKVE